MFLIQGQVVFGVIMIIGVVLDDDFVVFVGYQVFGVVFDDGMVFWFDSVVVVVEVYVMFGQYVLWVVQWIY